MILRLSLSDKMVFFLCNKSYNDPLYMYYWTIARLGGLLHMPTNRTMLGCLNLASMLISLLNYLNSYSSIFGLKFFLIATFNPLYMPLWIVLNPPCEICSSISSSLNFIYKIESESSWKDYLPLDLFSFTESLSSCLCSYSTFFCYDLYLLSISTILPKVFVSFIDY